ncbi:AAA family ATPase [Paenibacillus sp. NPDC058071]|uniref:AAA family ATPase n=1 Tax=Paenibacillus sp. NPDC058071 TaxID=3346326 RepID=UPI0036DE7946
MKLVIIFGPQAVGKMTVGQELEKQTGLKLFHNHMTIELVSPFFNYGSPEGQRLVGLFRQELFEAFAASDQEGMIFTYVWAFDLESDWNYIDGLIELFESHEAEVYLVELEAGLEERLKRNKTPHRLLHKPTKRDIDRSERNLISTMDNHRLNSYEGEIDRDHYLRINNMNLSPEETALRIKTHFQL